MAVIIWIGVICSVYASLLKHHYMCLDFNCIQVHGMPVLHVDCHIFSYTVQQQNTDIVSYPYLFKNTTTLTLILLSLFASILVITTVHTILPPSTFSFPSFGSLLAMMKSDTTTPLQSFSPRATFTTAPTPPLIASFEADHLYNADGFAELEQQEQIS